VSTLLVVEHETGCPIDRFEHWLAGLDLLVVRPHKGEDVPSSPAGGLLVLGGSMSAHDDDIAPWLPATRELMAAAVSTGVPTLGICLGAQLLAVACGGRVEVGAALGRECGVVDARWRAEAASDVLVAGLRDPFPGPSLHADAVTELPAGATWLAETDIYPHQAFRVGARAWGVQFHPEVSLPTFRAWAEELPEVDTDAVTAELATRDDEVASAGRSLALRFAQVVAGRRR
jgi:GMP synthase (glutamine-hydrolysing)